MKLYSIIVLLAIAGLSKKCGKEAGTPTCIQSKIDSIKKAPKGNPPTEITQYQYNNKTVYLISSPCCDQYNIVYDAQCNYVCAPTGGFSGRGDLKCTDFDSTAKFIKLIWKDER